MFASASVQKSVSNIPPPPKPSSSSGHVTRNWSSASRRARLLRTSKDPPIAQANKAKDEKLEPGFVIGMICGADVAPSTLSGWPSSVRPPRPHRVMAILASAFRRTGVVNWDI